jgi:hypothetical protein
VWVRHISQRGQQTTPHSLVVHNLDQVVQGQTRSAMMTQRARSLVTITGVGTFMIIRWAMSPQHFHGRVAPSPQVNAYGTRTCRGPLGLLLVPPRTSSFAPGGRLRRGRLPSRTPGRPTAAYLGAADSAAVERGGPRPGHRAGRWPRRSRRSVGHHFGRPGKRHAEPIRVAAHSVGQASVGQASACPDSDAARTTRSNYKITPTEVSTVHSK